jgi:soluble lytic murein transglycosylase-like protein
VPQSKPSQEEIAMLTQLQATDTMALASADTAPLQLQPADMATDRSVAMAYAIPQPKPLVTNDAAAAIENNVAALDRTAKPKTRSIELASADPALLQLQPVAQEPAVLNSTTTAMVEVQPMTRSLDPFVTSTKNTNLNQLITKYAALYEVPEHLVHHVVRRESNYNPAAVHRGNWGLMQIRYNTAKGMGYDGSPNGLLDAETNLKYAVKYLRGAWLVADRDAKKADWLYRTGYYYQAKQKGLLDEAGLK